LRSHKARSSAESAETKAPVLPRDGCPDFVVERRGDLLGREAAGQASPGRAILRRDGEAEEGEALAPRIGIGRTRGLQVLDRGGEPRNPHQRVGFGGVVA
jgi:hypothetical protein